MVREVFMCCVLLLVISNINNISANKPQKSGEEINGRVTVSILNSLPFNQDLMLHCKSGDDDRGVQAVPFNGTFSWNFRRNFFGTTLYFCRFQWHAAAGRFDIYKFGRDDPRCGVDCEWEVKDDGVHGYTQNGHVNDITFRWPSSSSSHHRNHQTNIN